MAHRGELLEQMPPTRGHDLKPKSGGRIGKSQADAPHTGARLETFSFSVFAEPEQMPPTRGHDLKLQHVRPKQALLPDAPHTGARLETF